MDRFQHVVRLQLWAHKHTEQFRVVRSIEDEEPIGSSHWTGAVSTYASLNPSFRKITIDKKTKLPVKIETYILDLDKYTKEEDDAQFVLSHEFTEYYGLKDLRPSELARLSDSFKTDKE